MRIDLHNHTFHSDGIWSVNELLDEAIKHKVDVIALTDHDSVFGINELLDLENKKDIRVIAGIELSTFYESDNVHIVGLFKDNIVPKEIYEYGNSIVEKRRLRAINMMNNIKDIYGLKIDLDDLFENGEVVTRGNMLRNIAKCNNLSLKEASFYVSSKSKAYIPSGRMSVNEGLALLKRNNAVAIFAHPCLVKRENVKKILDYGFDGIEVRYPLNKENDEEYFKSLANEYNLFISAGSDCHGDSSHAMVGTCYLDENEFEVLANKINFRKDK